MSPMPLYLLVNNVSVRLSALLPYYSNRLICIWASYTLKANLLLRGLTQRLQGGRVPLWVQAEAKKAIAVRKELTTFDAVGGGDLDSDYVKL